MPPAPPGRDTRGQRHSRGTVQALRDTQAMPSTPQPSVRRLPHREEGRRRPPGGQSGGEVRAGRSLGGWVVENKGRRAGRREGNSTESPKADLILTQGQGPVPEGPLRMLCPEPGGLAALPHRTRRSSARSLLQALAPGLVTASSDAQTLPALPSTGPPGPERQPRFSQLHLPPARERAPAHPNWDPTERPACGKGFSSVSITEATRNWVPWTAWGRTRAPSPSHLSWSRVFWGPPPREKSPVGETVLEPGLRALAQQPSNSQQDSTHMRLSEGWEACVQPGPTSSSPASTCQKHSAPHPSSEVLCSPRPHGLIAPRDTQDFILPPTLNPFGIQTNKKSHAVVVFIAKGLSRKQER